MKIIGVVGQQGSGKDTAADYIAKQYGYKHISTGDQIRAYIKQHRLGETKRGLIQDVIAKLRQEKGPAVIVDQILEKYPDQMLVLSGLRHPAEMARITQGGGFVIALEADQKDRYKRASKRNRVGDNIDFKTFAKQEARENGAELESFNIQALVDNAQEHVLNNGSFDDFYSQIDHIMSKYHIQKV